MCCPDGQAAIRGRTVVDSAVAFERPLKFTGALTELRPLRLQYRILRLRSGNLRTLRNDTCELAQPEDAVEDASLTTSKSA